MLDLIGTPLFSVFRDALAVLALAAPRGQLCPRDVLLLHRFGLSGLLVDIRVMVDLAPCTTLLTLIGGAPAVVLTM